MRSSPRFLVASRSGEDDDRHPTEPVSKEQDTKVSVRHSERSGTDDGAEVTVHLKVGYKTVLLVVVIFDLVHLSVRELINSSWIENFLGLS
jgi:hypothetical protein